jgi:hypothetical protein
MLCFDWGLVDASFLLLLDLLQDRKTRLTVEISDHYV